MNSAWTQVSIYKLYIHRQKTFKETSIIFFIFLFFACHVKSLSKLTDKLVFYISLDIRYMYVKLVI